MRSCRARARSATPRLERLASATRWRAARGTGARSLSRSARDPQGIIKRIGRFEFNSYSPGFVSEPAPQALTQRSDRAERTRQRILDAAAQCFAASGFSRTTVEAIAAGAGVSKALVYHHFRAKEAIFEELLERTLSEWARVSHIDEHRVVGGSVVD